MGFIETVVGVSIASVVLIGILATFTMYVRNALHLPERVQANFLGEEGLEALRVIRDADWTAFAALSETTRYLTFSTSTGWSSTETPQYIDGMLRSFSVASVSRDAEDDIVETGGTDDPQTKRVDVTVAWQENGTTTLTLSTYFANIHAD